MKRRVESQTLFAIIRKGVLAFYLWEFTDSIPKGMEQIMNLQKAFALIAMLIMGAAVGLALYIFLLRAFWICLYNG